MFEQHLHDLRNASRLMQIGCNIPAGGLQIASTGTLPRMRSKSSIVELHLRRMGDGKEMQYGIGRTADRHDYGDRILDRFAGDDVTRTDLLPDRVNQDFRGACCALRSSRDPLPPWWKSKAGSSPSLRTRTTWYWR